MDLPPGSLLRGALQFFVLCYCTEHGFPRLVLCFVGGVALPRGAWAIVTHTNVQTPPIFPCGRLRLLGAQAQKPEMYLRTLMRFLLCDPLFVHVLSFHKQRIIFALFHSFVEHLFVPTIHPRACLCHRRLPCLAFFCGAM